MRTGEKKVRDEHATPAPETNRDRNYFIGQHAFAAEPAACALHVVATPIGNLGDISLRALQTLAGADVIACEDTRVTSRLLARYGISRPLVAYHEHNAGPAGEQILARIAAGGSVALVSDAGTPLVSDPGYRLVAAARQAGVAVFSCPGASSVMAALTVSGLDSRRFHFEGFLPSKTGARLTRLQEMALLDVTAVIFESPNRLAAALGDIAAAMGQQRPLAICRELTKLHEEVVRGTAGELATRYASEDATRVKGEIVIVIGPSTAPAPQADPRQLLETLMQEMSVSRAAAEAVQATGLPKRELYRQALEIEAEQKGKP